MESLHTEKTSNLNNLSNNSSDPFKPAACCHWTLDAHEWLLMMMPFIPGCDVLLMRFHGKVTISWTQISTTTALCTGMQIFELFSESLSTLSLSPPFPIPRAPRPHDFGFCITFVGGHPQFDMMISTQKTKPIFISNLVQAAPQRRCLELQMLTG